MAPTVADYLLERLRAWDVRHIFAYAGDGIVARQAPCRRRWRRTYTKRDAYAVAKTTTMHLLMGYLRPTSGSARVHGLDCWRESPGVRARTGYRHGMSHGTGTADLAKRLVRLIQMSARPVTATPEDQFTRDGLGPVKSP